MNGIKDVIILYELSSFSVFTETHHHFSWFAMTRRMDTGEFPGKNPVHPVYPVSGFI